jgi:uncharacterized protein
VGSPLSVENLREELQVSHKTVSKWLDILERLYAVFRVPPFGPPKIRAVKKARKHYHMDWSLVPKPGPRFENLVASHLLKWIHFEEDTKGHVRELRYFRDVNLREVDFVVLRKGVPEILLECKSQDEPVNPALHFLKKRYPDAQAWQISATGADDYSTQDGIRVAPAAEFLKRLV